MKLIFKVPVFLSLKAVVEVIVDDDNLEATIVEGVRMLDQSTPLPTFRGTDPESGRPGLEALTEKPYAEMLSAHALFVALTAARDAIGKLVAKDSKPSVVAVSQPPDVGGKPN